MLGIAGASLLGSHEASAQNALDNSTPSDGETVNTSPEQILLEFAEPVGTNNRVDASCNSNPVAGLTQPSPSDDNRTLTVTVLQQSGQATSGSVSRRAGPRWPAARRSRRFMTVAPFLHTPACAYCALSSLSSHPRARMENNEECAQCAQNRS